MAMTQQDRSAKTASKRKAAGEEELRLRVRPGTKQALSELMQWAGIEEQGEAMTLMIHHLHGLGAGGALPMLEAPRHDFKISENVARKLERFRICCESRTDDLSMVDSVSPASKQRKAKVF